MNKLVIFDGNAIIHRAYHAIPPMTTKDGMVVHAVYGFISMYLKVLKDLNPTHVAVTFDVAGGSKMRLKKYDKYKATRKEADQALYDQIPLVHEAVRALGAPIYEVAGYEADDVIGTIVTKVHSQKPIANRATEIFIVTGDMDTLQLVRPGVKVYTLRKGMSDVVIYDDAEVEKRWGFKPNQMVDYKAIRGDTSDNIPGVPGIGEKGGLELIQKFGTLEDLYKQLEKDPDAVAKQIKPGMFKKLQAGKESALMSKDLATLICDVPGVDFDLEEAAVKPFDAQKITPLFQKFEFVSLLRRIPGLGLGNGDNTGEEKKPFVGHVRKEALMFKELKSEAEVKELGNTLNKQGKFIARALSTGADVFTGELTEMVIVVASSGYSIPKKWVNVLKFVFENKEVVLFGHDLKTLIKILFVKEEIEVKNKLFDTMVASYLLNPGSRAHDVGSILLKELGRASQSAVGQNSLFGVDKRAVAEELYLLVEAAEHLTAELKKADNLGLMEKLEMPLLKVLAEAELNGIAVDTKLLHKLSEHVKTEIEKLSAKIYKLAGMEFNIASPIQLREVLFEKLEIPVEGIKKGKTGLSTSAEELQKMKGLHPIIDEIETFRELSKLQNTYIDVLPTQINSVTHRIHTTYNQVIAATGRLSSVDPNLQNIPVRTELGREIRKAFIAEPGNVLVSADYSQIELRIVASLAEDKKMIEIFENGLDIHTATAAAINEVPIEKVTKDMRRAAKEVNFGILYGMGTHGLSWRAEIPYATAKAFIEKYFEQFSGVKKYLDNTIEFAKKEGFCETLFGRRRYIPELNAGNYQVRAAAERMAINHPIQGTAADLIKMAMIKVSEEIKKQGNKETKLLLQVHDELVLETVPENVEKLSKLLKETMESVVKLRVPVEVHVSSGQNWGEMK